jgi:RNA polymerase sigma factor for flagellar operon FliA
MTAVAHDSERAAATHEAHLRVERDELVTTHIGLAMKIANDVAWRVPPHMRADLPGVAKIALIEAAKLYRPGGNLFSTYAWHRIRGACLDSVRRRNWRDGTADQLDLRAGERRSDHEASVESRLIDAQLSRLTREKLRAAIFTLPPRLAVVMWMRYFEGRNHEELAASMGVNSSRVSQLHTEALGIMRAALSQDPCEGTAPR